LGAGVFMYLKIISSKHYQQLAKTGLEKIQNKKQALVSLLKPKTPKILILGGNGFVGHQMMHSALNVRFNQENIQGTYNSRPLDNLIPYPIFQKSKLNLSDLTKLLVHHKPDIIINATAMSIPQQCIDNPKWQNR